MSDSTNSMDSITRTARVKRHRNRTRSAFRDTTITDMDRPLLLLPSEVADLLRTGRKAVYSMIESGRLPGVTRIGRRVLVRQDDLLEWLRQKSAPSLER